MRVSRSHYCVYLIFVLSQVACYVFPVSFTPPEWQLTLKTYPIRKEQRRPRYESYHTRPILILAVERYISAQHDLCFSQYNLKPPPPYLLLHISLNQPSALQPSLPWSHLSVEPIHNPALLFPSSKYPRSQTSLTNSSAMQSFSHTSCYNLLRALPPAIRTYSTTYTRFQPSIPLASPPQPNSKPKPSTAKPAHEWSEENATVSEEDVSIRGTSFARPS